MENIVLQLNMVGLIIDVRVFNLKNEYSLQGCGIKVRYCYPQLFELRREN